MFLSNIIQLCTNGALWRCCKCNALSGDVLLSRIASIWDLGQKPAVMADKRQTPVWKGSIKTFLPQFKLCKYWNNFFRNIFSVNNSYIAMTPENQPLFVQQGSNYNLAGWMSAFRCLLKTFGDRGWWGVSKSCSCSKLRRRFYFLWWNSGLTGRVHLETWDLFFLSTLRQVHITLGHLLQCLILPLMKSSVLHNWKREHKGCKLEIAWFPRTHSSLERCQVSKHCLKVARNKFQSVTNCSQFSCFQCFHLWFYFRPFFFKSYEKILWFSR